MLYQPLSLLLKLRLKKHLSPRKPKLSKIILGIDEVGRGPWAGPLVIGAVILGSNPGEWVNNLTDSKKLTAKKRNILNTQILQHATATGLGWVAANELDRYGLSNSLKLATRRAVKQILQTKIPFDEIIIDGTINFLSDTPLSDRVTILKKADFLIKEVSAASIIAKVARDNYMINLTEKYPVYGFDKHVGYGTAAHRQALLEHGVCPEHRRSFRPIRELLQQQETNIIPASSSPKKKPKNPHATTTRGQKGEQAIIDFLQHRDHYIVAHNYKVKTCEIDIISTFQNKIYFTEVKYRQESSHGSAIDQITPKKHAQISYAAQTFISEHPEFSQYQPQLAAGTVKGKNYTVEDWLPLCD